VDATVALRLIDEARRERTLTLVGIGGHGGAGKSTLAALIPSARVVPTDVFWNGSSFEIGRIRSDVIEPLVAGETARFTTWDWEARRAGAPRSVEPEGLVVIEGVCALHRDLRDAYAVRIWVDAPEDVRLERGVARDGEGARATWLEVWIPSESRYVARDRPAECAHLVVDGTAPLPSSGGAALR
jgi:uridine kinase